LIVGRGGAVGKEHRGNREKSEEAHKPATGSRGLLATACRIKKESAILGCGSNLRGRFRENVLKLCCLPILQLTLMAWLVGQAGASEATDPPSDPSAGAFSRLLRERRFVRPGILTVPETLQRESVLPADFERQATLVLVADKLSRVFPETFASILAKAQPGIELFGLFSDAGGRDAVRQLLAKHEIPPNRIRLVQVPTDTIWIRDFGPVVARCGDGTRVAFDCEYRRRSGTKQRRLDNAAATEIARHLGIRVRRAPIELEAGNLLSNGRDLLVTTTVTLNANISRGHDAQTVVGYLGKHFGCCKIVVLEPLQGEPTGHVDTFACFTDPDTIVVGRYRESVDPLNSLVLKRNTAILAQVATSKGRLRVVRMAMPDNDDGVWRSYTNSLFANGVLLVPNYGRSDAQADRLAVETFRRLLPGWRVAGIDAGKLVRQEGALRCITLPVPAKRASDAR